ncbi:MAG: endonuclease/exonuclease/phosphatase family protein, partial [Nocardioides sp.]|nr:endonuclease/exonuclease/phosphatase family protein [Nocardioides sp.]
LALVALLVSSTGRPSATAGTLPVEQAGTRAIVQPDAQPTERAERADPPSRSRRRTTPSPSPTPPPSPTPAPPPVEPVEADPVEKSDPPPAPVLPPLPQPAAAEFTVASFNVLGSNHTPRGSGWADGVTRARWASDLVVRRGFSVVGLQEIQVDQLATVMGATGGAFTSYPPLGQRGTSVPQAIMWRVDTWDVLAATTFTIPFVGEQRAQAVVLLQHQASGQQVWFVNVHLSPRRPGRDAEGERNAATSLLIAQVLELQATGLPVVVTGDMNEKGEIFCDLAVSTGLTAANGGSVVGGCRPPRARIDWIFGSPALTWTGFGYQEDPEVRRITDHPIAVAQVRVG